MAPGAPEREPGAGPRPTVAIVIVTWNSRGEIRNCLRALGDLPAEWQVWVVDNASTDGTVALVREEFPGVHLVENAENLGFARANNQAIARTDTEYLLLLNPDTEASMAAIEAALRVMATRQKAGIVAVQLRNADGSLQPSCSRFPTPFLAFLQGSGLYLLLPRRWRARFLLERWWDHAETRAVDWVMGAFMLVRRRAIEHVGGVPENYFLYAEDMDWCYRMWRGGYEVWFTETAAIVHHGNRSGGRFPALWRAERTHCGKYAFCRRHYGHAAMRVVQIMDLVGYTLGSWKYRYLSRRDDPVYRARRELMALGRRAAWRALLRGDR